jgi:predicted dehydrogenase
MGCKLAVRLCAPSCMLCHVDTVRLGIVGLGNMGAAHAKHHAPALKGAELTAVCDVVPSKLDDYPTVERFTDSREMLLSGLVDAVLIATPHYDHTTIGLEAFDNGLHVLVEKPISAHKADALKLIDAYESALDIYPGLVFGAMFQSRSSGTFQKLRKLLLDGELGEVRRINWIVTNWFRSASYYASGGWRATWGGEGGGVLLNQCPHNLDMYQWLFGMPVRVHAFCGYGKYHDIEVEDEVTAYMEHANGATAVFVTTTGEAPGTDRLEIACDRGRLVYEDGKILFDRTVESVEHFRQTTPEMFAGPEKWACSIPPSNHPPSHLEVLQNFIDGIREQTPLIAPGVEGIHSLELANAMLYSSWTGKAVELPLDATAYEKALLEKVVNSRHQKAVREQTAADMAASYH